jgi:hypothetical protein
MRGCAVWVGSHKRGRVSYTHTHTNPHTHTPLYTHIKPQRGSTLPRTHTHTHTHTHAPTPPISTPNEGVRTVTMQDNGWQSTREEKEEVVGGMRPMGCGGEDGSPLLSKVPSPDLGSTLSASGEGTAHRIDRRSSRTPSSSSSPANPAQPQPQPHPYALVCVLC